MAINMWPWHEFYNWFSFIHSKHLSKSFCSILVLSRNVHWAKTCAILFSSPPPFLQKAFQETYSWLLFFKRRSSWLNTRLKRLTSFGFNARSGFAASLITRSKRLTAFGFIARSGYNFLVIITGHKGPTFLGVHCKKWA